MEINCLRPVGLIKPATAVGVYGEHLGKIENARVALQVRLTHLVKQGRTDDDTKVLFKRTGELERFIKSRLMDFIESHPAAPWFLRITGCSPALMGQIIAEIERFGKWYPVGDPMIPSYVTREPVRDDEGNHWVWVEGIERFPTPAKMDRYAGLTPDSKRREGKLLDFNVWLRVLLFRLGHFGFRMNAENSRYYCYGVEYKEAKRRYFESSGVKILPTPAGRFCPTCLTEKTVPRTTFYCSECNSKLGKKEEPDGVIWLGHLDGMAQRWMVKLWFHHFWAVWRQALCLPVRVPYPIEVLGHTTVIAPWDMCDLPEPKLPSRKLSVRGSQGKRVRRASPAPAATADVLASSQM